MSVSGNILINSDATPRLVIADFSSAVSDAALKLSLYDGAGPSKFEETEAYAPPEVLLSLDSEDPVAYDSAHPLSYGTRLPAQQVARLENSHTQCTLCLIDFVFLLAHRCLVDWGRLSGAYSRNF